MAKQLLTTPKGTAKYPWLNKADDKFGAPKYKVDLLVDVAETPDLTAKLEDILETVYADTVEKEGRDKYDSIEKEPLPFFEEDGIVLFRSTVNKTGGSKGNTWENRVNFYDAAGRFIPENRRPIVGGGSIIRVSFEPYGWTMPDTIGRGKEKKSLLKVGLSLRLKAIQVIEARQSAETPDASQMGFGAVEGGFQYDPDAFDGDVEGADTFEDAGDF